MIHRVYASDQDKQKLAEIIIDPSTQMDDFFDYTNVVIKKPWGREYLIFKNDEVAVWILHMQEGAKTSMHCHPNKKTSLVVLSGTVGCSTLDQKPIPLSAASGLLIDKGVFHSTEAVSPGVMVMEIETPTNKNDLVRLQDAYGRIGRGYESAAYHEPLGNTLPHFHADHERYNYRKQFGDCHLSFVAEIPQYAHEIETHKADVVVVVKGNVCNSKNECILEVGDTLSGQELQELPDCYFNKGLEFLIIKKTA